MKCIHKPSYELSGSRNSVPALPRIAAMLLVALGALVPLPSAALPQTGITVRVIGTISAVAPVDAANPKAGTLTIQSDQGTEATVRFSEATRCLLVPPGETDLAKATKLDCATIESGDRALARGKFNAAGEPLAATQIIIMSRTAVQEKHEADLEAWRAHGVSGQVTKINTAGQDAGQEAGQEIVIQSRSLQESKDIVLTVNNETRVQRYPPGKFRFADTVASSVSEIQVGDQLQVLGERNEDGSRIRTEAIIAGAFRTFAATILSVDAEANELRVKELGSGKTIIIQTNDSPTMRRLPERMARMLSRLLGGGQGGFGGGRRGGGRRPGGAAEGRRDGGRQGAGGRGEGRSGGRGGPPGSFRQMLSRAPEFSLAELKVGEALIISATSATSATSTAAAPALGNRNDNATRVAITILAGVEPLLKTAERGSVGGNWNFEINEVQ